MTLDEAIEYEKESLQHCKRMLEEIYEDNLENKILKFEVKQHEHLAEWLEDYKHIKQWKSDVMDGFCRYDASSFEELVANVRNKTVDDFVTKIKKYMEITEQATYIDEINNGNDNYSAMTIYDYVDELANELKVGEQNE